MKRFLVPLAVGALLALTPTLMAGDPLAFSSPKIVDPTDASGEPGLRIDSLGTIYINSLSTLHDTVHVSVDGGANFAPIHHTNVLFGGGDDDLAVDDFGGLYLAGQYAYSKRGCQSVSTSLDRGLTWYTALVPCRTGLDGAVGAPTDRPWLVAYRPNITSIPTIVIVHHAPCCGGEHWAAKSTDGGITFQVAGRVSTQGWFPGNLVLDAPRQMTYSFYSCSSGVCMASSANFGSSWTESVVAYNWGPGLHRVVGAVDADGNLYAVWADSSYGPHIKMSVSRDRGASWSSPTQVSTTYGTHIMPWIVAGDAGKVVVAWYETSVQGDPNSPSSMQVGANQNWAHWHVKLAQSLNALSSSPTWEEAQVSPLPIHRGVLCTGGLWCNTNGLNRRLLDFFEVAIDPEGRANLVYAQDLNWPGTQVTGVVNTFVKQTSGPTLRG